MDQSKYLGHELIDTGRHVFARDRACCENNRHARNRELEKMVEEIRAVCNKVTAEKEACRLFMMNSSLGVIVPDEGFRIIVTSPQAELNFSLLTGEGEIDGKDAIFVMPDGNVSSGNTVPISNNSTRDPIQSEDIRMQMPGGARRHIRSVRVPIDRSESESSESFLMSQKIMHVGGRESEPKGTDRLLLAAMNVNGRFLYVADIESGEMLYSLGLRNLLGYPSDEVPEGVNYWLQQIHPDDAAEVTEKQVPAINYRLRSTSAEYRIRHQNGHWLRVVDKMQVVFDSNGRATRLIGCITNIDGPEKAKQVQFQSQNYLEAVLNTQTAHIAILDQKGTLIIVNAAWRGFAEANGYGAADCGLGRNYFEICESAQGEGAGDAAWFAEGLRDVFSGIRDEYSMEYPCHSPEAKRWFKVRAARVEGDGDLRVIVAHEDITAHKLIENSRNEARGDLERRVLERTAELEQANRELRAFRLRLIAAQEEERKRIAAELHDSIGQTLAALKFGVETVLSKKGHGDLQGAFQLLETFIPALQRTIEDTRSTYMGLRPTILEEMGIIATLQWLCRDSQNLYQGIRFEFESGIEEEDIQDDIKIVIYRITQEALTNVVKHSKAACVDISLRRSNSNIELTISDDGVGFDHGAIMSKLHGRSLGLIGMRERAEILGGTFSVLTSVGKGTRIRVSWPNKKRKNK